MIEQATSSPKSSRRGAWARGLLAVAGLLLCFGSVSWAGEISMAWDPVPDDDVTSYLTYHGLSPDTMDERTDVGLTTSTTLGGLAECTIWYVGVKAFDGELESEGFSRLIKGYPRPEIGTLSPETIEPGETLTFTVRGVNFDPGDPSDPQHPPARAYVDYPNVEVLSTEVVSCREMRVTVNADVSADEGFVTLYVENPDLSWSDPGTHPWVFGQKSAAFEVKQDDDGQAPQVADTGPEPGAVDVPANVLPQVSFSEPVDPATVTPATVRLVDAQGAPVTAEAGSPTVDGSTVTIRPARPLAEEQTYRIAVTGGDGGVTDLAGNPLPSDYVQSPGFTIMADPRSDEASGPRVRASDPAPGTLDVPKTLSEVRITFDRDMSPIAGVLSAGELQRRFRVLQGSEVVEQASGSPEFRHGGQEVVIHLAETLVESRPYTTMVHLADDGLRNRLENAGHGDLAMGSVWMSSPEWRVAGPLEEVTWTSDADSASTHSALPLSSRLGGDNSGVPADATFHLHFSRPVTQDSLRTDVFRVSVQENRRYRPVELTTPIETTDGGRVVVLDPAAPLPSGARGRVRIFTGPSGIELSGPSGDFTLPDGAPMSAPFATAVSAEPASFTFGEAGTAEPEPGQAALAWDEPTDTLTAGFEVEVSEPGGETLRVLDAGPATEIQIPGLEEGRAYEFRLRPYDLWGNEAPEPGRPVEAMPAPRVTEIDGVPEPGEETLVSVRGANFMDRARVLSQREGLFFGRATVIRHDLIVVPVRADEAAPLGADDLLVVNPSPKSLHYLRMHPRVADVDGSGNVDPADAELLRGLTGVTPDDPRYTPAVDPNGDGVVDGIDVGLIEDQLESSRTEGRRHRR
jgi:hypothetical protein